MPRNGLFFRKVQLCLVLCLIAAFSGCAAHKLDDARMAYFNGSPELAIERLDDAARFSSRNDLVVFMEKGMIFFRMGRYQDSITELRQASELIGRLDIISITSQTSSLVSSEWATAYKGEYSERLWVHTVLMMDYLLLNDFEAALVEGKQALKIFDTYPDPLKNDHFTRALIALCFDNLQEYNDAFIEYEKLARQLPDRRPAAADLYRLATMLNRDTEHYRFAIPAGRESTSEDTGELVVFGVLGRAPRKIPGNLPVPPANRFSFPLYEKGRAVYSLRLAVDGKNENESRITTNVGQVAEMSLAARGTQIILKESARVAAKEAVAQAIENNNGQLAGAVAHALMFVTEEADTRGWETLPSTFTLLRIPLAAGRHQVSLDIATIAGLHKKKVQLPEVKITAGQRTFVAVVD